MIRQRTRGRLRRAYNTPRGVSTTRKSSALSSMNTDFLSSLSPSSPGVEHSKEHSRAYSMSRPTSSLPGAPLSRKSLTMISSPSLEGHPTFRSSTATHDREQRYSIPSAVPKESLVSASRGVPQMVPPISAPSQRLYTTYSSSLIPNSMARAAPGVHFKASYRQMTTEAEQPQQPEAPKSAFDAVADPSLRKTWLQIYSDMKLRSYQGSLSERISKNDKRVKARQQHMNDVVCGPELIAKLMKITPKQKIWLRKQGAKGTALIPFSDAIRIANEEELDLVGIRSSITNPPKDNPKMQVDDDGVIPLLLVDYRMMMEDLYLKDTVQAKSGSSKDINLTVNITRDDLHRKIEQCIDFMMDGNQVRFVCKSKRLAKVEEMVQRNMSHISKDEINSKTEALINKNKEDTIDLAEFTRQTRQHHNERALERIMAVTPRLASENDEAYQIRMEKLAMEERKAQVEEDKRQYQLQITQTTEDIQQKVDRTTANLREAEQTLKQTQLNLDTMIKSSQRRSNRGRGAKGRGGKSPANDREALAIEKQKKEVKRLNTTITKYRQQLTAYDLKLTSLRKGILVSPNLDNDFFDYAPKDDDDDDVAPSRKKQRSAGSDDEDGDDDDHDDDDDDDDFIPRDADDHDSADPFDFGKESHGKGGGHGQHDDDNDGDLGGGNDDGEGSGAVSDDDDKSDDKKKKLSKRELDFQKQKNALSKMTVNQRLSYLAQVKKKTQYPVLASVTEILAKLSTIVQMERENRKKSGDSLENLDSGRFSQSVVDSMSNKERKRYLARISREESDPNFALKSELANAMKLLNSNNYILNDALYEKNMKRSFWYVHDGGDQNNIVKNPSFNIRMTGTN